MRWLLCASPLSRDEIGGSGSPLRMSRRDSENVRIYDVTLKVYMIRVCINNCAEYNTQNEVGKQIILSDPPLSHHERC